MDPTGMRTCKAGDEGLYGLSSQSNKSAQQIMGDLPPSSDKVMRPFQHAQLDLMGPFMVKGLGGAVRRTFKAWAAVWD